MRVLIADDEEPARALLRKRLEAFPQVQIVGEAEDALELVRLNGALNPDLIILDVQMPEISGFDCLPYLTNRPMVVFCTAYDHYAVKAFEERAIDYLLKPATVPRLEKALSRAQELWKREHDLQELGNREGMEKIVCRTGSSYVVMWIQNIYLFSKVDRYTAMVNRDGDVFYTDLTIEYLGEKLDPKCFFHANRGTLVRRKAVAGYQTNASNGIDVATVFPDHHFTVGRRRAKAFRDWMGVEDGLRLEA